MALSKDRIDRLTQLEALVPRRGLPRPRAAPRTDVAEEGAPVLARLITTISSRFSRKNAKDS